MRWALAVACETPAISASSVAGRVRPCIRESSIATREGSLKELAEVGDVEADIGCVAHPASLTLLQRRGRENASSASESSPTAAAPNLPAMNTFSRLCALAIAATCACAISPPLADEPPHLFVGHSNSGDWSSRRRTPTRCAGWPSRIAARHPQRRRSDGAVLCRREVPPARACPSGLPAMSASWSTTGSAPASARPAGEDVRGGQVLRLRRVSGDGLFARPGSTFLLMLVSRWWIRPSACRMILSISSLTVGMSWMSPATIPQLQAPASTSPSVITLGRCRLPGRGCPRWSAPSPFSRSISSRRCTPALFSTRSVLRSPRMISRVSSSEAATSAFFTFSWTGASFVAMKRVPCSSRPRPAPAPRPGCAPSAIPPDATKGIFSSSAAPAAG